jgi:urease accessory protein
MGTATIIITATTITTTEAASGIAASGIPALPAASLLQLIWLASPALPVGGFSYSEGLESAVQAGLVESEAQAREWLLNQFELGLARAELPLLARAIPAWRRHDQPRIEELHAWYAATRESSELRAQGEQMGRSLTDWLRERDATDPRVATLGALRPAPGWPLAFALAASRTQASPHDALVAFAFSWAENMVQATVKCVPLGQRVGQRILAALAEAIIPAAQRALGLADADMQAFLPMLAILSSRHETQYSRLFRS